MSRNTLIAVAVAIVVLIGVFIFFSGRNTNVAVAPDTQGTATVGDTATTQPADMATTAPADATTTAPADATTGTATEPSVREAREPTTTEPTAADALTGPVDAAAESNVQRGTGTDAAGATAAAVATQPTQSASQARLIDQEEVERLTTVEGFDFDRVAALVMEADIDSVERTTLLAALDAARTDPSRLPDILERVREALNRP